MYAEYWGLAESPFAGPDEEFWFHEGPVHEEAIARLCWLADEPPRCGLLLGDAGTGKSLLLEILRARRGHGGRQALLVDAAGRDGLALAWDLAAGLGLGASLPEWGARQRSVPSAAEHTLWRGIGDHLEGLRIAHHSLLVMFDDVDRAEAGGLRAIERLFADARGLDRLSIVLAARSDGARHLSPSLLDRCDLRIELPALDEGETAEFVVDLLHRAGAADDVFDPGALVAIHERSEGVPRRIRRLCDLSLLAGMSESLDAIDAGIVHAAADELEGLPTRTERSPREPAWSR